MNLPNFLIDHPDGEIRLTGHRIGLFHVVVHHNDGESPEALHKRFPTLPIDLIRDVLTFYREHEAEIDAYVRDYEAELDRQEAAAPSAGPSLAELRRRRDAMKRASLK